MKKEVFLLMAVAGMLTASCTQEFDQHENVAVEQQSVERDAQFLVTPEDALASVESFVYQTQTINRL